MGRGTQRSAPVAATRRGDERNYAQLWHETYEAALREGTSRSVAAYRADSRINAMKVEASGRPPVGAGDYEPYY